MNSNKPVVAIVNSSSFGRVFASHLDDLAAFATVKRIEVPIDIPIPELQEALSDVAGIIASTNPDFPADLLKKLPKLKIIARHGIGYNNVDVTAAQKLGIAVTNVHGPIERNSVAEHAVALLMAAARHIPQANNAVRADHWDWRARYTGPEISGKTLGLIGHGNIGSRFAEIMSRGFGCPILAYDPNPTIPWPEDGSVIATDLDEILAQSDAISLHAALTPESKYLLNRERLTKVKPGTILVNTARGALVEPEALADCLDEGIISSYAADVVEGEPVGSDYSLLRSDRVIIVPHLGGYGDASVKGMGDTCVQAIAKVLRDHEVPTERLVPGLSISQVRP